MIDDGSLHDGPGASLPSVPSDPAQNVEYLRNLLGDPFVDWVLADPTGTLTPAQLGIAADLAGILRREISRYPELPVGHAASLLAFYHKPAGTTILNYARQYVGGASHEVDQDPDDRLLSSFHAFASECYGEMLLPGSTFGDRRPDFHQYARTQAGRDLTRAIIDEGIFPSGPDVDYSSLDGDIAELYRSHIPGSFASGLINYAWRMTKLQNGNSSLAQLMQQVPLALEKLRSYVTGNPTAVPAIAALTGVRLPAGVEISGPWGRIRAARPDDHPPAFKHLINKRTMTTTDAGEQIEISDAGDIILETTVRIEFKVGAGGTSWSGSSLDDHGDLIDRVRLAFALAITRPARPVIFCTWATTLSPVFNMDPHQPLNHPEFMVSRTPTLLTADEVASWERWIGILTTANMKPLKVAMIRTLRAIAERRDTYDRLIDAVIAWESLFGAVTDSTLRVCGSLARLLHDTDADREAGYSRYKKVYDARSKIVHANSKPPELAEAEAYGRTAIDASLKVIEKLLTTHLSLLSLESSQRSQQVLLGGETFGT